MIDSIEDLIAFLKQFHRHWLSDELPDMKLDASLIPADLPYGLAQIYKELGALFELEPSRNSNAGRPFATQDCLVSVEGLKCVDGTLEFAWENQGNWSCRCPLSQYDPPVYSNSFDVWSEEQCGYQIVCDSLNHFLTTLCLQEAVMSCRWLEVLHDTTVWECLTREILPLWLNGYYVDREPTHSFYEIPNEDVLIMDLGVNGIWIGSPQTEVKAFIREEFLTPIKEETAIPPVERLLEMIQEFQEQTSKANQLLREHLRLENPMYWRKAGIAQTDSCGPDQSIRYYYHESGCIVKTAGLLIDWDYGLEGRVDGFTLWKLSQFAEYSSNSFSEFRDPNLLKTVFEEAIERGLLHQAFLLQQDDLFYLRDIG
jgi:hypothetical protein